ncbi:MAG: 30S ribosomal protein S6, partial [Oscillospiraceae bacterium]|nr:30S ribosomal protein S6 [Oscillospiraceae bacterium]
MSAYETMLVISTKLEEEARAALLTRFCDMISDNGSVVAVEEWGKRRLAYEINKETDGYYVLITFECDPTYITELERVYRITDNLLRTMVIRLESVEDAKQRVKATPVVQPKPEPA